MSTTGPRECFVPRPGHVFFQADYGSLELVTLAQTCMTLLGRSDLATALNDGLDPHTALGAQLLGTSYADAVARIKSGDKAMKEARQLAKVANFGFPGGLGYRTFVAFAAGVGVTLTEERARELKTQWMARWSEMRPYFDHVSTLTAQNPDGMAVIKLPATGMIRGGCNYTAGCNTYFQGLGAAITKRAHWLVARGCYVDRTSPLFGSRIVNMIHDELIGETPDTPAAHDVAIELERLMIDGAAQYLPDVKIKAPPLLMRWWSKDAVECLDAHGRLVPWPPPGA